MAGVFVGKQFLGFKVWGLGGEQDTREYEENLGRRHEL
jgi:hypothetical protein